MQNNKPGNEEKKGRYAEFLDTLKDGDAKKYIVTRIIPQINYYSGRSQQYQKQYYWLSIASIILNAIIPIFVLLGDIQWLSFWTKIIIAACSSSAGICTAIISLKNYRELWVQYRVSCELLKGVMDRFFLGTSEFSSGTEKEKIEKLEKTCSEIMNREHGIWKQLKLKGDKDEEQP